MSENLVQKSHNLTREYLRGKNTRYAVDATLGRGRDALFLTTLLCEDGEVFGFDVQPEAIVESEKLFAKEAPTRTLKTFNCSHSLMLEKLPESVIGKVGCVFFNLGWLPLSDKKVITHADSTLEALNASLKILEEGGVLSILSYRGHEGGELEYEAVCNFFSRNGNSLNIQKFECSNSQKAPVLFFAHRA